MDKPTKEQWGFESPELREYCRMTPADSRNTWTTYGGHDGKAKLRETHEPAWYLGEKAGVFYYAGRTLRSMMEQKPKEQAEFESYWTKELLPKWQFSEGA